MVSLMMVSTESVTFPVAVAAGAMSFASGCVLPVVPAFVAQLLGRAESVRRRTAAAHAITFVAGFSIVLGLVLTAVTALGWLAGPARDGLRVVGGVVIVVLGLQLTGLIDLPGLLRQWRPQWGVAANQVPPAPDWRRSALLGAAFGIGWTPCVGPVLAAVIGLAATTASPLPGYALLLAYSIGLGLPFVLVAVGVSSVMRRARWFTRHHRLTQTLLGVVVIGSGLALVTGHLSSAPASWLQGLG